MKIYIKILVSIATILLIFSCAPVKDALEGKQRKKVGEEFLIEKKNPLSLPSTFDELPQPADATEDEEFFESSNDIEKLLGQSDSNNDQSDQENSDNSIERLISEEMNID
tara:strand:+ start:171 stop:500 length:330 start_codon:yes stop_codon:yes gene_type:complete